MTTELDPAVPVREITIHIPVFVAQKMAESFEGTLEDAALAGLKLIHGMGRPAYAALQDMAKQGNVSVPKMLRAAIGEMQTRAPAPAPAIGRPRINTERDTAIFMRVSDGQTYAEVAASFGVSLVRVGQIVAQQRALRGINSRVDLEARNADILRRVNNGDARQDVATALGISRSVVDNLISAQRSKYGQPAQNARPAPTTPEPTPPTPDQPEDQKDLSLNVSEESRPRYVMPSLAARQAQQAEPVDARTAVERDVVDPEFGF
jgi:DNA-binding CsgD family transcriptional regulator